MNENRRFGFVVGSALALLGAVLHLFQQRPAGLPLVLLGALLMLLAVAVPRLLAPARRAWMAFARVLARVNTALFLSLVFFLVLAPLGFAMRLSGRDELLRRGARRATTWVPYPERNRDRSHYEKMF